MGYILWLVVLGIDIFSYFIFGIFLEVPGIIILIYLTMLKRFLIRNNLFYSFFKYFKKK